jgi:hypothetical protein
VGGLWSVWFSWRYWQTEIIVESHDGSEGTHPALLTREVRWFRMGSVPLEVEAWFADSQEVTNEHRLDLYDLAAARRGVGRKQRNRGAVDSKHRLMVELEVSLAPGLVGDVEDWLKITHPPPYPSNLLTGERIEVSKDIRSRRYPIDGEAGCEVELASLTLEDVEAWSLCFETFGHPDFRQDALRLGVTGFLADSPLPAGLVFEPGESSGYPAWLASHVLDSVAAS